jgi:broad specificity phosphatase PhoE
MQLLLVRHGQTEYNAIGRYQGHMQIALDATGQRQAQQVCRRLQRLPIDAIYSSDLVRCIETITPLAQAKSLPIQHDHNLREIDVGLFEHLTVTEIKATFPSLYAAYRNAPGDTIHPGGESYRQLQRRAMAAIAQIAERHQPEQTICIASHGGTIRAIVCALLHLDINSYNRMWIENCAITTLSGPAHDLRLVTLNDFSHATDRIEHEYEHTAV